MLRKCCPPETSPKGSDQRRIWVKNVTYVEGFLAPTRGGFFPIGGGGPFIDADDIGLGAFIPQSSSDLQ